MEAVTVRLGLDDDDIREILAQQDDYRKGRFIRECIREHMKKAPEQITVAPILVTPVTTKGKQGIASAVEEF